MTPAELDELERLEKAATEGPWHFFNEDDAACANVYGVSSQPNPDPAESMVGILAVTLLQSGENVSHVAFGEARNGKWEENAKLIAALRNAAPALIAAARENARLKAEWDKAWELWHRAYGPCDALGPDGACSECSRVLNDLRGALSKMIEPTAADHLAAESMRHRMERDAAREENAALREALGRFGGHAEECPHEENSSLRAPDVTGPCACGWTEARRKLLGEG